MDKNMMRCHKMLLFVILVTIFKLASAQDVIYTIHEELKLNTFIGNIRQNSSLKNIVSSDNVNTLTYSILQAGNAHAKLFNISSKDGNLYTAARVDREALCLFTSKCELFLEVAVHSSSFYSYKIKIVVLDTNDNSPTFTQESEFLEIPESSQTGVSFPFDGAVDNDTDKNSLQSYEILPQNVPFGVSFTKNLDGTSTVSIIVKSALDRERTDSYLLTLVAKDNGSPQRSGSMLVNISILDVNDNAPQFTQSIYNVTVKENTLLHTVFFTVKATDRDIGTNKKILYRLSSRQPYQIKQHFEIDEQTGDLKIKKALPSGQMRVIVEATDRGSPTKSSQAEVEITILDTNNQRPSIIVNLFNGFSTAHVSESKHIGYAFAHVKVIDPDTGNKGNVKCYSQTADFDLKQMDVNEYKVVVAKRLDRETIPKYTVAIFCEDSGVEKLNASAVFDVEIDDENDNAPRFLQKWYDVSIPENNAVNDTVLQVAATDKDIGINSQITYTLSENAQPYFFIQPGTFMIKASKSFDRENMSYYSFFVIAVDGGKPPLTASAKVTVNILDINDERPSFSQNSYIFYIVENCPINTAVGNVSAVDMDTGLGGEFSFILSPSFKYHSLPFTILQNGTIITTESIDAEAKNVYSFKVIATDHATGPGSPLSGMANVKVIIVDENDNKPVFMFPNSDNYSITVHVPKTAKTIISWVRANDPDIDAEGVLYSLLDRNLSRIFKINETSGQIYLSRDVDGSHIGYYELLVTALDKSDRSLFNTTVLKVFLQYKTGESSPEGSDQNVVIVIALVCATVVIAASVLVVLCYIRKCDKDKAFKDSFSSNSTTSEGKSSSGHDLTIGKCVKEQQLNDSIDKPVLEGAPEEKEIFKVDLSTPGQEDTIMADRDHQRQNQLASFRLHQALQHINSHRISPLQTQQVLAAEGKEIHSKDGQKPADDYHSNSSGETITGDSGHGSDDEVLFPDQAPTSPRRIKLGVGAITNPLRHRTYTPQQQNVPYLYNSKSQQSLNGLYADQRDGPRGPADQCLPYNVQNGPMQHQNGSAHPNNGLTHPSSGSRHPHNRSSHPWSESSHPEIGSTHPNDRSSYPHSGPSHPQNTSTHPNDRSSYPHSGPSHPWNGASHSRNGSLHARNGSTHRKNGSSQPPSHLSGLDKNRDQNTQAHNQKPSYKRLGVPVLPTSGEGFPAYKQPLQKSPARNPHRTDNLFEGDDTTTSGSYSILSDDTKFVELSDMAFAAVTDVYV
ncbi:protocadherin-11 X-linked-like isoform X2 [Gigantopelta aegis]|uniref:protocadherin-11 X-linked-like isoform X2 n=1 Tax=Gigantopelta aegis TaxID=1735272 RepID=UPI001B88E0D7|nr:protocadherin-11 X-linked-like isoform X2 [Gigantopelta aegis]